VFLAYANIMPSPYHYEYGSQTVCPISHTLVQEILLPVGLRGDTAIYEAEAILTWLLRHHMRNPCTNEPIASGLALDLLEPRPLQHTTDQQVYSTIVLLKKIGYLHGCGTPSKPRRRALQSRPICMLPICLRVIWLWFVTVVVLPCVTQQCATVCLGVEFALFIIIACFRVHDNHNWVHMRCFFTNCLSSAMFMFVLSTICRQLNRWYLAVAHAAKA